MGTDQEAMRQQWLLRALRGAATPQQAQDWLGGVPARQQRGLRAYRLNAAASAARALAAAYPTLQPLLGEDSFAALAAALWQAHPPRQGDLAAWGADLPGFIATDRQLAGEPYLADVARLDWALHQAGQASDDEAPASGLQLLAGADPAALHLRLRAGHAVLVSAHPVHTLWEAHRSTAADRFVPARQALAACRAEAVRVRRDGLAPVAERIDATTAGFEQALLGHLPLAAALSLAGAGFDFEAWFITTLRTDALAAVLPVPTPGPAW